MKTRDLLWCLLAATCPAWSAGPSLPLAGKGQYHERMESDSLVSGGTVLGLQAAAPDAPLDPRKLAVYLAGAMPSGQVLCVHVTTSAGNYWSRNVYNLGTGARWALLETQSRHVSQLESVHVPAFAVRAELRRTVQGGDPEDACGSATPGTPTLLVAGVGSLAARPSKLSVMINSKRRPAAKLELLRATDLALSALGSCVRLRDITTRAYDTLCEMTLPPDQGDRFVLQVSLLEPGEDPDVQRVQLIVPTAP